MIKYKFDIVKSKALFEENRNDIYLKDCYRKIFRIFSSCRYNDKFSSGEWKIAYGYMRSTENLYVRHCFIVDKEGCAIDPTAMLILPAMLILQGEADNIDYFSFAALSGDEWLDLIELNDCSVSLEKAFVKEAKDALAFATEHNFYLLD